MAIFPFQYYNICQGGKCMGRRIDSRELDKWARRRAVVAKFRSMDGSRTQEKRGRPDRITLIVVPSSETYYSSKVV